MQDPGTVPTNSPNDRTSLYARSAVSVGTGHAIRLSVSLESGIDKLAQLRPGPCEHPLPHWRVTPP